MWNKIRSWFILDIAAAQNDHVAFLKGKRTFIPKGTKFTVGRKVTSDKATWPSVEEFKNED
jgi:hypothetical protein